MWLLAEGFFLPWTALERARVIRSLSPKKKKTLATWKCEKRQNGSYRRSIIRNRHVDPLLFNKSTEGYPLHCCVSHEAPENPGEQQEEKEAPPPAMICWQAANVRARSAGAVSVAV